jgi:hypothetical protein
VLALADHVVRIPMSGEVESLNVGVATGISVYELRARMALATLGPTVGELTATVSDLRELGYTEQDRYPVSARRSGTSSRAFSAECGRTCDETSER